MEAIDYSVTIRTLGRAGDKYLRTLKSISCQTIKPKEIIIVLPEGYDLPQERLGNETYVFSSKGMVSQRLVGFDICSSPLILALDDDVEFDVDFVERMYETMLSAKSQFVIPVTLESSSSSVRRRVIDWLMGVSIQKPIDEDYLLKIWRTGGFIVNSRVFEGVQYFSQSGHVTCIFGFTSAIKAMHFEDELWLQDTVYALPDDQVFFYKLYLTGNRIVVNRDVRFVHLDASTTLKNSDKTLKIIYASARNGIIFWHRFICSCRSKKWLSILCIIRRVLFTTFFALIKGLISWNFAKVKTYIRAYYDGLRYLRSEKYRRLSQISDMRQAK